jgi:hypothetical protein
MEKETKKWATEAKLIVDRTRPSTGSVVQIFESGYRGFMIAAGACDGFCVEDINL